MNKRAPNHPQKRTLAVIATALATVSLGWSSAAQAACAAVPALPVWTYPADGDVDVPLNADLLMIRGPAGDLEVLLDGQPLERSEAPGEAYDLGELQPGAEYLLTLIDTSWDPSLEYRSPEMEIRFRTAEDSPQRGNDDAQLEVADWRTREVEPREVPCREFRRPGTCQDAIPPSYQVLSFEVEGGGDPELWVIEAQYSDGKRDRVALPASCGRPAYVTELPAQATGYVVHALDARGGVSTSNEVTATDITDGGDSTGSMATGGSREVGATEVIDGGCSTGSMSAAASGLWPALVALALCWRRRQSQDGAH